MPQHRRKEVITIPGRNNNFQCSVRNKTANSAEIVFYGDIVADEGSKWSRDDICPRDVAEALDTCRDVDRLDIYINSGGGSVFAGNAIYNRLKAHKAHKTVHIDGLAASIASVIALAGDEILMPKNAYMMIHKVWDICIGNADELRDCADRLDLIELSIINIYGSNAAEGISKNEIAEKMRNETWLTAGEAAKLFPKVKVEEAETAAACVTEMSFRNAPEGITMPKGCVHHADEQGSDTDSEENKVKNSIAGLEAIIELERSMMNE